MKNKTSGHLTNNGGIRAHSAGEFFPFRVIATGKMNAIKWHVVKPDGTRALCSHGTTAAAFTEARVLFSVWSA